MSFKVYIPARFDSSRLPGKALADLGGRPLIEHVYARAVASGATEVVIATDDDRIARAAEAFGATVCMTAATHQSGSERLAEAVRLRREPEDAIIVNLQGDEPFMPAAVVRQVAACLEQRPQLEMASVCEPLRDADEWRDPNAVKVVRDEADYALYFSRAPIPYPRDDAFTPPGTRDFRRHVGLYAYRVGFLQRFVRWPAAALEQLEKLEQLRALAHGARILVEDAAAPCGVGVDTPDDLARARAHFAAASR